MEYCLPVPNLSVFAEKYTYKVSPAKNFLVLWLARRTVLRCHLEDWFGKDACLSWFALHLCLRFSSRVAARSWCGFFSNVCWHFIYSFGQMQANFFVSLGIVPFSLGN